MMNISFLIKLTENDKRVLICLCILVLLIIVLVGYLSLLVKKIMEFQGKKIDTMMYDIMKARVIIDEKTFRKVARYKSNIYFFKKTWLPLIIGSVFVGALLIYGGVKDDIGLNFFVDALKNLSFGLKWPMGEFFGITMPVDWPTVIRYPDLSWDPGKYLSYLCLIGFIYSGIRILISVQSLISRELRIRKLRKTYFTKDLNKLSEKQI